jgi:type IV pilus assembly protein PilX
MNLTNQSFQFKTKQTGVVLFLAMIALVVMSLAAAALIRSVDTNSMITGNLSYKQTAAISSSYGIESMVDTLGPMPLVYGDANDEPNGYYAVCTNFDGGSTNRCSGVNLTADASWNPGARSRLATGNGITPGTGRDAYGNTIQYIVERMCNQLGAPTRAGCLQAGSDPNNSSKNALNEPVAGAPGVATELPLYRVTVRIAGPKNTVSYVQAFIS